jgi:hypothetical protein
MTRATAHMHRPGASFVAFCYAFEIAYRLKSTT